MIDFHEIGMENSKTVAAGEEFHMDADVEADNKIDKIEVELHPEGDHMKKGTLDEWEIDTVYTGFSGLRNTNFHEHIDVPLTAEPGTYHFYFKVTDMEGYQTVYEDDVEVLAPAK